MMAAMAIFVFSERNRTFPRKLLYLYSITHHHSFLFTASALQHHLLCVTSCPGVRSSLLWSSSEKSHSTRKQRHHGLGGGRILLEWVEWDPIRLINEYVWSLKGKVTHLMFTCDKLNPRTVWNFQPSIGFVSLVIFSVKIACFSL